MFSGSLSKLFMLRSFFPSAFGCSNPTPPANGFVNRQGDHAIITCEYDNAHWEILCMGGQWHGDTEECSASKHICISISYVGRF